MTLQGLILANSADNFTTLYNDQGSGADADVQLWKVKPPAGYLPCGDVCEAAEDAWIYGSNPPRGQVVVVSESAPGGMLANPTGFVQIWSDKGSGAKLNGAIWQMIAPVGFTALGYCCTFSSDGTPAPPDVRDYYCVNTQLVSMGQLGPLIWADTGSGADQDVGLWRSVPTSTTPFASLGTFWATNSHSPTTVSAPVLLASAISFG